MNKQAEHRREVTVGRAWGWHAAAAWDTESDPPWAYFFVRGGTEDETRQTLDLFLDWCDRHPEAATELAALYQRLASAGGMRQSG